MIWEEESLKTIVQNSLSQAEVFRKLGLTSVGRNGTTLRKYCRLWNIDTSHFDPYKRIRGVANPKKIPDKEVFVENSTYLTGDLIKKRLYNSGIKTPICELCGQNEIWYGKKITMILDHINGKHNDNRLENLRIVCPNCNATLETHCGKKKRIPCPICGKLRLSTSKHCSRECYMKSRMGEIRKRKVNRPSLDVLIQDIEQLGYTGTGRKYGVSDNAIRIWVNKYKIGKSRPSKIKEKSSKPSG